MSWILTAALQKSKKDFGYERPKIQSGDTLNSLFLREKLLDYIDLVVAPLLVGGKETATLIDGKSITTLDELNQFAVLKLESA